jgi:hypothetical protein
MKNSNDTIGNRTGDLPACSTLPQPTAPPHAPTPPSYLLQVHFNIILPFTPSSSKWSRSGHHHHNHHHHNHHHQLAIMQLGHLLTRSVLTLPEVSLVVSFGFFNLLVCSVLLSSVICYEEFCLHVATNSFPIPVFCPNLGLYFVLL